MVEVTDSAEFIGLKNKIAESIKANEKATQDLIDQSEKVNGKIDESVKAANAAVDGTIEALKSDVAKLGDMLQLLKAGGGAKEDVAVKSYGEAVALSPGFWNQEKDSAHVFKSVGEFTIDPMALEVKKFLGHVAEVTKAKIDTNALLVSGVLLPEYLPDVNKQVYNDFHVSSLFSQGSFSKTDLSWVEWEGYSPVATLITADVAIGDTVVAVSAVEGLTPSFKVVLVGGLNNEVRESFNVVSISGLNVTLDVATTKAFTVAHGSVLQAGRTAKFSDRFRKTGIDGIMPGGQKPFGYMYGTRKNAKAITLATMMQYDTRSLDDYPALISEINKMTRLSFPDMIDQHCVYGDGSGSQLQGMAGYNKLDSFSQGGSDNIYDTVRRGIARQKDIGSRNLSLLCNDFDIVDVDLLKDSNGSYLRVVKDGKMWNVPFHTSTDVDEKQMFLGDFKRAGTLRRRSQVRFIKSLENRDNVEKNEVTFRHEQDMLLTYENPEMISKIALT